MFGSDAYRDVEPGASVPRAMIPKQPNSTGAGWQRASRGIRTGREHEQSRLLHKGTPKVADLLGIGSEGPSAERQRRATPEKRSSDNIQARSNFRIMTFSGHPRGPAGRAGRRSYSLKLNATSAPVS